MSKKDIIYIDAEDDITTLIDKVNTASAPIVALVLPKRFPLLQSSVNMKLLKKSTTKSKKRVVLITNEATLMPLAAAAGIHVAESLKSRPAIPEVDVPEVTDVPLYGEEPAIDMHEAVGDLAGSKEANVESSAKEEKANVSADKERKALLSKIRWPGKLSIPNFSRFRNKVILLLFGLFVLIGAWIVAFMVLPQATIAIIAQTSKLPTKINFTADPTAEANNFETGILVAQAQEIKKNVSRSFQATGEKDIGEKATGVMTVQNCDSSNSISIPAKTTFTDDTTGFAFLSDEAVNVPGGDFNNNSCSSPGEADVPVTAASSGDNKNLSPRNYIVSSFSNFVTGFGGQMSGGTTEIVKVVTQADIDKAAKDLTSGDDAEALGELSGSFGDDMFVLGSTFQQTAGKPVSDPAVGAEATEARITAEFQFSVIAVKRDDLVRYLEQQEQAQIENSQQSILDNGLDTASVSLVEKTDKGFVMQLVTDAYIGPEIDVNALAEEISGKRYSDAVNIIKSKPGVKEATVNFSPFWVYNAPRSSRISISIQINDPSL